MENSYNNRDFEHFVKQNADQYRMFPSEKVWNNIHHTLHQRNKWYGFGLSLLLLSTAAVTWVMLTPSNKNQQLADRLPVAVTNISIPTVKAQPAAFITPATATRNSETPGQPVSDEDLQSQNLFMTDMSDQTEELKIEIAKELAPPAISMTKPLIAFDMNVTAPAVIQTPALIAVNKVPVQQVIASAEVVKTEPEPLVTDELKPVDAALVNNEKKAELENAVTTVKRDEYPLTIESVINSYTKKKSKLTLQTYFTPTVSYRRLREDNQFLSETQSRGTLTNATVAISDVENIVTHKPDYGLQLGVTAGYEISPRLTFITGLQFNVNKYDIRAYNYPAERATIALIPGAFNQTSFETETTYRNYSGSKKADWLHNLYFSASLPIGLQVRLSGAGKSEIGVGGSIQPTYILGNRTYLLSTDYKNYAEAPSLIRKWNMSTSLEAYAGISTGKIDWRIGPQVRYQLLSSYKKEYPVKEHLFDFGLKVGIILNK